MYLILNGLPINTLFSSKLAPISSKSKGFPCFAGYFCGRKFNVMGRHSHKQDYKTIMSQRSPDHQLAVMKMILSLIVLTIVIVYLFAKA